MGRGAERRDRHGIGGQGKMVGVHIEALDHKLASNMNTTGLSLKKKKREIFPELLLN
jgi:hypothetical protein